MKGDYFTAKPLGMARAGSSLDPDMVVIKESPIKVHDASATTFYSKFKGGAVRANKKAIMEDKMRSSLSSGLFERKREQSSDIKLKPVLD